MTIKQHTRRIIEFPLVLLLIVISTSACVSGPRDWPSVHGVVLDKDTNEPVIGAYIIAHWGGSVPRLVQREGVCYRTVIVTSDEQGKFTVPFWLEGFNMISEEERRIKIYKPGMSPVIWPLYPRDTRTYYMLKENRIPIDRLKFILNMYVGHRDCNLDDDYEPMLIQLYREVWSESVGLAENDKEKKVLKKIRYWIASDWNETANTLTYKEADMLFEKKLKNLIEDD